MTYIIRWAGAKGLTADGKLEGDMWLVSVSPHRGMAEWTEDKALAKRFATAREAGDVASLWHYPPRRPLAIVEEDTRP